MYNTQESKMIPVFASFAGLDNLGHAVCKSNNRNSKVNTRCESWAGQMLTHKPELHSGDEMDLNLL
jgi:hypothetical protein